MMQCENCGEQYDDSFEFCPCCGKREAKQELPEVEPKPVEAASQEKLILIVDDDETIVRMLSDQLTLSGYKAIAAPDGEQAVMIAHRKRPDLILLDIAMPGLHGFSVIDKLRQSDHTKSIPIVIVSAFNDPEHIKTAELQGIEYVIKPFSMEKIMEVVGRTFD
jgi:DNA-binding response OmpR family regulator